MVTFLIAFLTLILTIFSVSVMSFIAMAVPVGPWIDVTLVLLSSIVVKLFFHKLSSSKSTAVIGYSTAAASIGGSVATACGFAFPTLYFLNPDIFATFLQMPVYFVATVAGLTLVAGGMGMLIANLCAPTFLADPGMSFPIGQMLYSLMSASNNAKKAYELVAGIATAVVFSALQLFTTIIPRKLVLMREYVWHYFTLPHVVVRSDWMLMLLAIGFVTGHVIAIPLLVGVVIKFLVADPIHHHIFCNLVAEDFFFAFCSGIVVQSTFMSIIELPHIIMNFFKKTKIKRFALSPVAVNYVLGATVLVLSIMSICFFSYFSFSLPAQFYLIVCTALCTYQIAIIGGKTGLAPIGRFATWVMVPFLMLFGFDPIQVTLVATCVEISGMVVVDTLFGRKMGQLAHLDTKKLIIYQIVGLLLSAVLVGGIFWLLISHFGLGATSPLIVQRCQARALLINASNFNAYVMILGIVIGFFLRGIKINSTLVLGGLLLPIDFSLLLIAGGLVSYVIQDRDKFTPFWSGVFAASALCMVLRTLF